VKKPIVALLVIANLGVGAGLVSSWNPGHAQQLSVSDLRYGWIDTDGNGEYTPGDDFIVDWLLEHNPQQLETALKTATVRADGGVDLSAHLASVRGPAR